MKYKFRLEAIKGLAVIGTWAFTALGLHAEVSLPKVIGDNMVLQREKPVYIWGTAAVGEKVTVTFGKQVKQTAADNSGNWKVVLDPMKASFKPVEMVVAGTNTIRLKNILVGEVWLCSGQSNMEYVMKLPSKYAKPSKGTDLAAEELKKPVNPNIRLFLVQKKLSFPDVTTKGWQESGDSALMPFSAPAYFYGKELYNQLKVPIGLISSSWGGSRIEPWTPAEAYQNSSKFKNDSTTQQVYIDGMVAGKNYKSMIAPLAPFSLRGFIWYQGESNCMTNETLRYCDKFKLMVDSWRKVWNDDKLPFYFVQIAPYYYTHRKDKVPHTDGTLPLFWEAQSLTLQIPFTGMTVVNDLVDNLADIHPSYKWEVGRRLSLIALAKDYGRKGLEYSGPVYKSMAVKGSAIELEFTHADGLKSADSKPLTWFSIAGDDGIFVQASAVISGNRIVVSSPEVKAPKNVRFAWSETAMPNLANKAGLPAVPFRTNGTVWSAQ